MCGRFTVSHPPAEVQEYFALPEPPAVLQPRYNIAPSLPVPVVGLKPDGVTRGLAVLSWGLLPDWSNATTDGRYPNARAETVATKPAFSNSFRGKRCLIVASGFYEWRTEGKAKQPFHFRRRSGEPLAFAGLWQFWTDGAAKVTSCCLITTSANELMRPIHDRMPVILGPADLARWLDPATDRRDVTALLRPLPGDELEGFPVSAYVSKAGNEGPRCIESLEALAS